MLVRHLGSTLTQEWTFSEHVKTVCWSSCACSLTKMAEYFSWMSFLINSWSNTDFDQQFCCFRLWSLFSLIGVSESFGRYSDFLSGVLWYCSVKSKRIIGLVLIVLLRWRSTNSYRLREIPSSIPGGRGMSGHTHLQPPTRDCLMLGFVYSEHRHLSWTLCFDARKSRNFNTVSNINSGC